MRYLIQTMIIFGYFLSALCMAQQTTPYKTSIVVDSRSNAELEQGVQQALRQVLTQVSGNPRVNENETIQAAIPQAKKLLEQYAYEEAQQPGKKYLLSVSFDPQQVNQLLHHANQPIWKPDRPLTIAWIAIEQKDDMVPQLLTSDDENQLLGVIQSAAQQRAVPVMLPVADLQGINAVSIDDVWTPLPAALQKASLRYHSDAILIGKVTSNVGAKKLLWRGEWMLLLQGSKVDWDSQGDSLNQVLTEGVNGLANALSQRFAEQVIHERDEYLMLAVYGVSDLEKYSSLSSYLTSLPLVSEMQVENIAADHVIFKLMVQGGESVLTQTLSKDHIVTPIDFYNQQHQLAANLNYQLVS